MADVPSAVSYLVFPGDFDGLLPPPDAGFDAAGADLLSVGFGLPAEDIINGRTQYVLEAF